MLFRSVSALPPFNGFISELLIYLGLLGCLKTGSGLLVSMAALAIMMLALTGALAVIGFTRFAGIIYLGSPRSEAAANATEPPLLLWLPMALGAAGCLAAGILATPILNVLRRPLG